MEQFSEVVDCCDYISSVNECFNWFNHCVRNQVAKLTAQVKKQNGATSTLGCSKIGGTPPPPRVRS